MRPTLAITRKELNTYFSSPMALIFVGAFLAASLFTFFWVDEFFSRGIADLRSLFRWMPVLMIFLVAALTMRQWSEEQQTGTLEMLFTMPMKLYQLVLGKFFAVLILVIVALALTLFLPITISFFGSPDVGPIIGGYLAAILMSSAYIAIGLFVSSRTANQIVALILTVLVCGIFQLVGSREITSLFNADTAEILRAFGTGSRFESIERGVVDLRDLVYYVSLTAIFLLLNIFSLDNKRWGQGESTRDYRMNSRTGITLLTVNLILLNVILFPFNKARLDLTEDQEYSLSSVTRDLLENLEEPLLIRGYFSEKNHPLLSPLIPRVEDTLEEYRIASNGNVEVEILDPIQEPEKETEANQTYGIRPTPLQTTDRYGASIINVYFDILIRYGDQSVTLNFSDLIDVTQYGNGDIEVQLRNLEYDLTRSIKKVVYGFQSVDAVLASLDQPAQLILYYTPETLPDSMQDAPETIQKVADEISSLSNGKFVYEAVDVNDPANRVDTDVLATQFGITPIAESFFAADTYYLHMVLLAGNKTQVIYPGAEVSETEIRSNIESALQRASSGFLKVVGLWTPPNIPMQDAFGQMIQSFQQFSTVGQVLSEDYEVQPVDLSTGQVPATLDVLFVIAPQNMTDLERYAIDQYLMRGGTVFVAAGNYQLGPDPFTGQIALQPIQGGLQDMLTSYGITVEPSLVLDKQNTPFPTTVTQNIGGVAVQQIQAIEYPFFVNVRQDGFNEDSPIFAQLPAVTLNWTSPLTVDEEKMADAKVTVLMKSSDEAWTTTDLNIQPDLTTYPNFGFPTQGDAKSYPLAVMVEGSFQSFFKDQPSPFGETPSAEGEATTTPTGLIETSPATARLIVVGSSEFLNDNIFDLSANFDRESYLNTLQFVQNTVDWATEDTDLLSIRSRGASTRLLDPLSEDDQNFWEGLNYALALVSLVALGILWQWRKRTEQPMPLVISEERAA